jgi:hypothetical protein
MKHLLLFSTLVLVHLFAAVTNSTAQRVEKKPADAVVFATGSGNLERKGMRATTKPAFSTLDVSKLKSGKLYIEFKSTGKCVGALYASANPVEDDRSQSTLASTHDQNFHEIGQVRNGLFEQFRQSQIYLHAKVQEGIMVYYEGDCTASYQYTIFFLETNSTCSTIPYNPAQPTSNEALYSDWKLNGNDYSYPQYVKGKTDSVIFYVNGIETGINEAKAQMVELSRITGSTVWLVYNASSLNSAVGITAKHFKESPNLWSEYWTVKNPERMDWAKDHALNNPPAARRIGSSVEGLVKQGIKVSIIGYSQGAAIVLAAMKCFSPRFNSSRVRILLIGGAAKTSEIVGAGPVSGFAHKSDGVAEVFGDAPKTDSYVSDLSNSHQHTNYLKGQSTAKDDGDAEAVTLIKRWVKGENFGFKLLQNVP